MDTEAKMSAAKILEKPYARILVREPDGRVTAEIMEFPGCVAFGDNEQEALRKLDEVAIDWIDATLEQGQEVPEPMDSADFSGRLGLRMTRGLHKRAAMCADREGVSLNQFITTCLAEAVGERSRPSLLHSISQFRAEANVHASITVGGVSIREVAMSEVSGSPVRLVAGFPGGGMTESNVGMPSLKWAERKRERQRA
jgi:antitoxin HicB